jgi:hypothetical protein
MLIAILFGVGLLAMLAARGVDGVDLPSGGGGGGEATAAGVSAGQMQAGMAGDGQAGGGAPAEPADPWAGEVPEHVREAMGVSSYADLRERMESNERLVQGYQELARAWGQQGGQGAAGGAPGAGVPAAQPAQSGPKGYMAWPSYQAFQAEFQANPEAADLKRLQWVMKQSQGELQQGLEPVLQQRLAPLVQQATQQRLQAQQSDFVNRYPDAKRPEIVGDKAPVGRWMTANEGWLRELAESNPNVNVYEIAFKCGDYDRMKGELEALKKTAGSARAMAGVTRTNVGGAAIPGRPKTHNEAIMRAVEDCQARGVPVPAEWVEAAQRAQQMAS